VIRPAGTRSALAITAAALATVVAGATIETVMGPSTAAAGRDPVGRVIFARGDSLWLTDALGKAAPLAIATLPGPASDVRTIRTDAAGDRLLVDDGGRWYWADVPAGGATATLALLPCGPGAARLARDGRAVLCADERGRAWFFRLSDGRGLPRDLPAASATFVERAGVRGLVWADGDSGAVVWSPLATRDPQPLAPAAPLRGLLAAPDGSRAVGTYRAPAVGQPISHDERDQLFGFALDGIGARRRLIRDGVALDWSWDSRWLLIQDRDAACIVRAVGGEYKCWKGFTAVSVAPDGTYALVLGPRPAAGTTGDAAASDGDGDGEGGGGEGGEGADEDRDDEADDDAAIALPKGPLALYRATLAGPYSKTPAVIVSQVDGAAVWLP
jgi:hypothetical protein